MPTKLQVQRPEGLTRAHVVWIEIKRAHVVRKRLLKPAKLVLAEGEVVVGIRIAWIPRKHLL